MTYGKDGILKEDPKDILINTAFHHDIDGSDVLKFGLHKADQAWALTLYKAGLINDKDFSILLEGLLSLEKDDFELNPAYGDIYNSKSKALQSKIGDIEGYIHTGRPRREAVNIAYLITLKQLISDLYSTMITLANGMIDQSEKYSQTIMPDMTYLHHAQPTTFGHYLMTFLFPLLRELEKLDLAFSHIDSSPSGSGSVNGTRLPVDREYAKKLLSFSNITLHTRDAMWQVDTPIEIVSILSSTMTNLNRLVDELQIFNTMEFSLIKLPDSLCRASVIMPQKQNPYPLAYIRGIAGEVLGKTSSYSAYGKITSGNPDSRTFIYLDILNIIQKTIGALKLLDAVMENIKFNETLAYERVSESFLYATDIADWFILHDNIPYKEAHRVVGAVIRDMQNMGLNASQINIKLFEKYIETSLDEKSLASLIKPENIIQSRTSLGGANDMKNLFEDARSKIETATNNHKDMKLDFSYLQEKIEKVRRSYD